MRRYRPDLGNCVRKLGIAYSPFALPRVAVISRTRRTDPLASTPLMRGSRAAAYWAVVPPDECPKRNMRSRSISKGASGLSSQSIAALTSMVFNPCSDWPSNTACTATSIVRSRRFLRQIAFAAFAVADLFDADGEIAAMCGLPRHIGADRQAMMINWHFRFFAPAKMHPGC